MSAKNNLIMSVLRLTKDGPIEKHLISKYAHTPIHLVDNLLENLSEVGFIQLAGNRIEASLDQRVKIALHVMKLGADPESVCTLLQWKEFERISAIAFELNHFKVRKGLRFKSIGRRWEIDVVGCKDPLIICADCKHHHRGWTQSAVIKAAAAQGERTEALARALPVLRAELGLQYWDKATLIPMVLSLAPTTFKFHQRIPVVPILQLQSLLNELPAHIDSLNTFSVSLQE